MVINFSPSEFN